MLRAAVLGSISCHKSSADLRCSGLLRRFEAFPHEPVVAIPEAPEDVAVGREQVYDCLVLHGVAPVRLHHDDVELHPLQVDGLRSANHTSAVGGDARFAHGKRRCASPRRRISTLDRPEWLKQ